jgi:hypothetical protein
MTKYMEDKVTKKYLIPHSDGGHNVFHAMLCRQVYNVAPDKPFNLQSTMV